MVEEEDMTGLYNLVETQLFTKQVTEIGDIRHIDEMLGAKLGALHISQSAIQYVPGTNGVRLLKLTDRLWSRQYFVCGLE